MGYNLIVYFHRIIIVSILITSCSGGGGTGAGNESSVPFAISLPTNIFSVDEDTLLNGSIAATANEVVTLTYSLTSTTTNGVLTLTESDFSYKPNPNFFGQDKFTYSVTAVEKNITQSDTVTINVGSVNDRPEISIIDKTNLDKDHLLFDSNPNFSISYFDEDNTNEDLVFSASINQEIIPVEFTATGDGRGNISLDLSSISSAGYYQTEISVSDGDLSNFDSFRTWIIANKRVVTVAQDDDKSDGFDSGTSTDKDYYVYYLIGGEASLGRTDYLFVADSLNSDDVESFRDALLRSINRLNDSEVSHFIDGYFDVIVAEPVNPDGTSLASIETGCYDWDENIFCIGSNDINVSVFDDLFTNPSLVSVLTMISGRGVNLGNTNIQPINSRTDYVLMHELGHAHGEMGDEYLTSDDRDVSFWADRNVNTTTQSDPSQVKWKHHIDDLLNVAGSTFKVCYNWSDGTVGLYNDEDITTCDCLYNLYDANGNRTGRNPDCNKVGLFEGNYYGEFDNYRPKYLTVMETNTDQYGEVNAEGFAIGSIHNQGFTDGDLDYTSDATGSITSVEIEVNAVFDSSKLTLKWYEDGIENTSLQNQVSVSFLRPSDNSVKIYTWRVEDLSGTVTAPDDVLNNDDFYEGLFNSSFYWCDGYWANDRCSWSYNPSSTTYSNYDYGYMVGPIGGTWAINWARW